mgnify:CR=1 FL=1
MTVSSQQVVEYLELLAAGLREVAVQEANDPASGTTLRVINAQVYIEKAQALDRAAEIVARHGEVPDGSA